MKILKKKPNIFRLKNKQGQVVPFKPNKVQKDILELIQKRIKEKGKARLIVIKGRQQGVTTLMQLLALSYVMTEPAFNSYTMAHDATVANDIFEQKIKFAFDNLNQLIKNIYQTKRDNTRQLMFENELKSSNITVGLSARGTTQNFLHISEAGKMSQKKQLWDEMITGSLPASESAKVVVIESTPDGGMGQFYDMVQNALSGKNEFEVLFLKWTDNEEYQLEPPEDNEWKNDYLRLAQKYQLYKNPQEQFQLTDSQFYWYYRKAVVLGEQVKVQYPLTLDEAFITASHSKFDLVKVKGIIPQTPVGEFQGVKVLRTSQIPNQKYSVGIDIASGLGNDYSAITIRGFYPEFGVQHPLYAQAKLKISTDKLSLILIEIGKRLNNQAYFAPERNAYSDLVIKALRDHYDESKIYQDRIQDPTAEYDKLVARYGFITKKSNRHGVNALLIDEFSIAYDEGKVDVLTEEEKSEMLTFVWDDDAGRYDHLPNAHDDVLISDFVCLQNMKYIAKYS